MKNWRAARGERAMLRVWAAAAVVCLVFCAECLGQASPAGKPPAQKTPPAKAGAQANAPQAKTEEDAWIAEAGKHRELIAAVTKLVKRWRAEVQFPPARSESRLLPLLPPTTAAYLAYPNLGEALHQAMVVFRQERETSPALRAMWEKKEVAEAGPKIEDVLERVYRLSQYLGDEVVISGDLEGREPKLLIVAEVKKPGLKEALEETVSALSGTAGPRVIVFDPEELEMAKDRKPGIEPVVLVRKDYVAAALDVPTLRRFSESVDAGARRFAKEPFGMRVAEAYRGGVMTVGAADLGTLVGLIPIPDAKSRAVFERTGFADMKYLVWAHRHGEGRDRAEMELSFTGPRHGVASWLAGPGPMGSLDYVSPDALFAAAVLLKSPAQMFDDAREIARASNENAFAGVDAMEQMLEIKWKDDLLSLLSGEFAVEVDSIEESAPKWRAMARVSDAEHLQKTIVKLLALSKLAPEATEERGVTYYRVIGPPGGKKTEVDYAFVDGYLIAGPSREIVAEAAGAHGGSGSVGKSKGLEEMRAGHPEGFSAVSYQHPGKTALGGMAQKVPELAELLAAAEGGEGSAMGSLTAEPAVVRGSGSTAGMGMAAAAGLLVGAIAIPNLMRSRGAANEASAVGTLRTVNTAEVTYSATYPNRGFAPDLSTLGPEPGGGAVYSENHAGMIGDDLGNASCTAGAWCTKSGYRFAIKAVCLGETCPQYAVTATPEAAEAGSRNFCSTDDGIIRYQAGPPLEAPLTRKACRTWPPLQ